MPGPELLRPPPKTLQERLLEVYLARGDNQHEAEDLGAPFEIPGLDTAARTVWGETRGDPASSSAVAAVLLNRLSSGKHGETLADVAKEHKQFSPWNKGDPNRKKMLDLDTNDPLLAKIRGMIESMAIGHQPADPTGGATMFHAVDTPVTWDLSKLRPAGTFGAHKFYRTRR